MKNLLIGLILIFSVSLIAQRNENNDYWNSWRYTPKKEMAAEFESAVVKKMQKFKKIAKMQKRKTQNFISYKLYIL